eukprot:TRINITY_DN5283_c0_g1_i11.p1 TRINITY_DN5283_c0_g1~~TRINITY_DN5283_c0_g1_i11.p1  ORF type:complete len:481 (-),score=96.39 TRINITY_DN5283_c0_g1_i11:628-2070(-)
MTAETDVAGLNMYSDISNLEAPVFSTIDRKPPAHVLKLNWDHQVNLVGKKVPNPMFHCCDICRKPILIYGRMIPCKHVFCFSCAKQNEKICPRCKDKVKKVEQCELGSIFLCTQDGTRYGNSGCRRTYLSSRDLQAHIKHRHTTKTEDDRSTERKDVLSNVEAIRNAVNSLSKASLEAAVAAAKANNAAANAAINVASSSSSSVLATAYKNSSAASPATTLSSSKGLPPATVANIRGGVPPPSTNQGVGPYSAAPVPANQSAVQYSVAPNQSAAAYTPGAAQAGSYRPQLGAAVGPVPGGLAPASGGQIAVLNTRQSTLISVPIHAEAGGAGDATQAQYPPGTYPGYNPSPYTAQYPGTQVAVTTGYTQGNASSYSQPPPAAYSFPGGYGATAGQYSVSTTGPPAGAPSGPYSSAPTGGAPPPTMQPHFHRPPPTGVRPPPAAGGPLPGSRQPAGGPPPRQPHPSQATGNNQPGSNYFRR